MTRSLAAEVERRRGGAPRKPSNMAGALGARFVSQAVLLGAGAPPGVTWPQPQFQKEPVRFFRECLGDEPWERQVEIIEGVCSHKRVAVSSGHKIGKSRCAAGLALWFYSSFDDARVVMSSTTSRQVDQILWRELRKMHKRSRVPLDGEPAELARSGLKAPDFREVVGFTAREAEAVAGISGANLLYLLDEASGIPDAIFEAIEGNRAGGAWVVMFSNPTRTEGEFYEAFASKAEFYKTFRISSEESPNVRARRVVIPGLATWEWVEEKRREWGVDSALYKIRVKGEHVLAEDGKILSVHAITEAEDRWDDTEAVGRLHLGLDPAGPGGAGDESTFAPRRGKKVLAVVAFRGLSTDDHVVHALGIIKEHRTERDAPPVIVIDREGPIGMKVYNALRAHLEKPGHEHDFIVLGVRASERAQRQPKVYDRTRDELWANFAAWLREGGAIPEIAKLAKELHSPSWEPFGTTGRIKVTSKDDLRKALGRSPDHADAAILSTWESSALTGDAANDPPPPPVARAAQAQAAPEIDPYEMQDEFADRGRGIYGP